MLRFGADSDAMNSVDMELFVRFDDERLSTGTKDTLFIYKTQGDASSLLAILVNVGVDFRLENDHIWENATITDFVVKPKLSDFNQLGDPNKADAGSPDTLMGGTSRKDMFLIDENANRNPNADWVFGFSRAQGDMLRFKHDGAAADDTDITLYTAVRTNQANNQKELHIFKTQGDESSLLALMRDIGSDDFNLTNDDVWENLTVVAFEVA